MTATCGQNFSRIGRSPDFLWPFEIFGPIGRNGNEKFKGAPKVFGDRYQKSAHAEVASCIYRHAKFRDDTMTFTNIKADIFKTPLPPIDSKPKSILIYSGLPWTRSKNSSTRGRRVNWKTFELQMTTLTHSFVAEWHGQASIERRFSVNKELVVENQSVQTLAARWITKDLIIHVTGFTNVEITRNMVVTARNARARYANSALTHWYVL